MSKISPYINPNKNAMTSRISKFVCERVPLENQLTVSGTFSFFYGLETLKIQMWVEI